MSKITKHSSFGFRSKHEEQRFKTSNIEEMKSLFTANRVTRSWFEDFVDEDTGEVASIERKEIILDRGTLLDNETLQTINFHLMAGDIKEVEVSNQCRTGFLGISQPCVWSATLQQENEKKNIYLTANSLSHALEIAKDYAEQTFFSSFHILQIKQFENLILITDIYEDDEQLNTSEENKAYKIELSFSEE